MASDETYWLDFGVGPSDLDEDEHDDSQQRQFMWRYVGAVHFKVDTGETQWWQRRQTWNCSEPLLTEY